MGMIRSPSETIITGTGLLNRIKLTDKNGIISGVISIRISDNNIVSFTIYQREITSSGKKNPSYLSLKTVMNEYKDVTQVENIEDADIVTIKDSKNKAFPNAKIYIKTDFINQSPKNYVRKSVNFINREIKKKDDYKMIFKIYGCYVEKIDGNILTCRIIDYNKRAVPMTLNNVNSYVIEQGQVLDVGGFIIEGLKDGEPVCNYDISVVRKSDYCVDDFIQAIENYNLYVKKQVQSSPF